MLPGRVHLQLARVMLISMLRCATAAVEIVGCAEQQAVNHASVRGEGCCIRHTVRPLDAAQPAPVDRFPALVVAVVPQPFQLLARPIVGPVALVTPTSAAGPPAFLSHRAL